MCKAPQWMVILDCQCSFEELVFALPSYSSEGLIFGPRGLRLDSLVESCHMRLVSNPEIVTIGMSRSYSAESETRHRLPCNLAQVKHDTWSSARHLSGAAASAKARTKLVPANHLSYDYTHMLGGCAQLSKNW
jgi:hypothetical protein